MRLFGRAGHHGCHGAESITTHGSKKLVLVGRPNVGKSVIFSRLTGMYSTISNYPGTTVEVFRGEGKIEGEIFEIVDTPGMHSLTSITDDERVARAILMEEDPDLVIHIVDAKNLEGSLPLTLQLIEAGFQVILDLNMMDEAEKTGMTIDTDSLEGELGVPVVATVASMGRGLDMLKKKVGGLVK